MCQSLRTKYPQDFTVSRDAAIAWRKRQIADCLREGSLAAAAFHQYWLLHEIVTSKPAAENGRKAAP
jgi:hypothetical protein